MCIHSPATIQIQLEEAIEQTPVIREIPFLFQTKYSSDISDALWEIVEPLLADFEQKKSGGSKQNPLRSMLNSILYRHNRVPVGLAS